MLRRREDIGATEKRKILDFGHKMADIDTFQEFCAKVTKRSKDFFPHAKDAILSVFSPLCGEYVYLSTPIQDKFSDGDFSMFLRFVAEHPYISFLKQKTFKPFELCAISDIWSNQRLRNSRLYQVLEPVRTRDQLTGNICYTATGELICLSIDFVEWKCKALNEARTLFECLLPYIQLSFCTAFHHAQTTYSYLNLQHEYPVCLTDTMLMDYLHPFLAKIDEELTPNEREILFSFVKYDGNLQRMEKALGRKIASVISGRLGDKLVNAGYISPSIAENSLGKRKAIDAKLRDDWGIVSVYTAMGYIPNQQNQYGEEYNNDKRERVDSLNIELGIRNTRYKQKQLIII